MAKLNASLRGKILIIVTTVLLTAMGTTTVMNSLTSARVYEDALQSRAVAIGQSLTLQLERLLGFGLILEDIVGFDAQTQAIVEAYPGIELAMVVAPSGTILFSSDGRVGSVEPVLKEIIHKAMPGRSYTLSEGGQHNAIIAASNPQGVAVASIVIAFPHHLISEKIHQSIWKDLLAGILVLLVGLVLLHLILMRFVTSPLKNLIHTVTELRRPPLDLTRRAIVTTEDELGQLGETFNGLMDELRATTVSKAELEQTLIELHRVSEALFEQKEHAEVTLHSIGDAVISVDKNARIRYMNPVAQAMIGKALDEVQGRRFEQVFHLADTFSKYRLPSPFEIVFESNEATTSQVEAELVQGEADALGVTFTASPMHDALGNLAGGVLILRDVSAERHMAKRLSWEASHDPLTGLVNRREFNARIKAAMDRDPGSQVQHVVWFMDLDRFKLVNDTAGHAAGDELLVVFARLLESRVRETDVVARLGGDEFALLMENCGLDDAERIAAGLLADVSEFRFNFKGRLFTVGISIGLAATGRYSSGAEVLSMADVACYMAKKQGRNRVCVYRTGDSDAAAHRREVDWVSRINLALAEDRFTLYHQSYLALDASNATLAHMEVLLRMIDEEGRLVLPSSFIPAAERYGLMPKLDRWVIAKVFSGYHKLIADRDSPLTCAINLSGTSLNEAGLFEFVLQQAKKHQIPEHAICFEITETAAIDNLAVAAEFISGCKSLGFLFALDDFGTGTSSFGYLKSLPVDYLKIDGGFVRNIDKDDIDRAMTETINRIGHLMGIRTVAEFAENDQIIQRLRDMGVDYAQGYGVCRPTPLFTAAEVEST